MANALAHETSPYLLQHADNPVDWLPWGEEALRRAREIDRPLLVSIGYSACHWCHVMERESFEDAATAALMNERFVCVKVDREERPDVDALYMEAVQAMTGQGGWPLNVFLTPEQVPFYGGTYFPPAAAPRHAELAPGPAGASTRRGATRRDEIRAQGERMAPRLAGGAVLAPSPEPIDRGRRSTPPSPRCARASTACNGGWGGAPKFPRAPRSSSSCSPAASRRWRCRRCARWPRAASSTRSAAAFAATRRRDVDRAALREDALRQRAARARLPARLPGRRRRGCCAARARRRSTGRCARCARPRAASSARSTPTPRASRAASTSGAVDELRAVTGPDADAAIAWLGRHGGGQLRGRQRPRVPRARASGRAARADPRRAARGPRARACARDSTTSA